VTVYSNASGVDATGKGVLKWIVQRTRARLPRPPAARIVGVAPDLDFVCGNRTTPAYTWIGHSSGLLQIEGVNVLFDPVFSRFASPVPFAGPRRHQPPGLRLEQLPPIDAVVLSHNHYDHLDRRSVRALARQPGGAPRFVVPSGLGRWFKKNLPRTGGARGNVQEVAWHEQAMLPTSRDTIALHFLPVQHWSNRSGFDRNQSQWGSWAVIAPGFRFWFSGDLGYSDEPRAIGEQFGPFDAAAIAIGAYEPRWFMRPQHVNPDEAVQVMLDVQAREAIAIHWGTFALTDEPLDQPPRDLAAALAARQINPERFRVLRHGETRQFASSEGASTADVDHAGVSDRVPR
jgi:N-acyl-phosphatidylethanolamine-hydrolysing phospholipase D